jgi:hypothetical protein
LSEQNFKLLSNRIHSIFGSAQEHYFDTRFAGTEGASQQEGTWSGSTSNPPASVGPLHDKAFVVQILHRIDALLLDPVRTRTLPSGETVIGVLGTAAFVKGKSGQLHPFLWDASGSFIRTEPKLVMVTEVPYGTVWLRHLISTAVADRLRLLEPQEVFDRTPVDAYVHWLKVLATRQVLRHHDMRAVRKQIAQTLELDADSLRLCYRMHVGSPLGDKACVSQYNLCVRRKAELLEVERVAPRAVGIYAALCERKDFPTTGEPTQRLKGYLHKLGMGSRTWLLVMRDGGRLLTITRQFYAGPFPDAVLDTIAVMDALKLSRKMPDWLSQAIFAEWGNAGSRKKSYRHLMGNSMVKLRHLVTCASKALQCPDQLQEEQLAEVVHWATERSTLPFTRTQRQGGWTYLVREARDFHRLLEEREAAEGVTWTLPFEAIELPSLRLLGINSAVGLLEEGRKMRNCAGSWIKRCASEHELLVSVRSADGRRVATASYQRAWDRWTFGDAKGPLNRPIDAKLTNALRHAARLILVPQPETDDPALESSEVVEITSENGEKAQFLSPAHSTLEA